MIAVSTIRLDLESSRAPGGGSPPVHNIEIDPGNPFSVTRPQQQPDTDLFGVPWWEAMDDGF